MALMAMMMCFGALHPEPRSSGSCSTRKGTRGRAHVRGRPLQGGDVERDLRLDCGIEQPGVRRGRLSMAMNAISITRTAEGSNRRLATKIRSHRSRPARTADRARARDGRLRDLEVRPEQGDGAEVPDRPGGEVHRGVRELALLQLPVVAARRSRTSRCGSSATTSRSRRGKYVSSTRSTRSTRTTSGYPGFSNAAIDEVFNKFLIPQMFAEVAQGKRTPEDAAEVYDRSFKRIWARWRSRDKI